MANKNESYYNETIGLGKLGVNFIRSLTDENQCYFNEIKQENDVGIDAFIELTKNGENDGKCIAVQIKTGASYFNKTKTEARIPIENHYRYWKKHTLKVYGIVCDYDLKTAYWVSITDYLKEYSNEIESGEIKYITFSIMEINKINSKTFETIFKRIIYGNLPELSFENAMSWTESPHAIERSYAVNILAKNYADKTEVWDRFFELLNKESDYNVLCNSVYYISYIPRHPDLWGDLNFSEESKKYGKQLIKSIDCSLVTKMLSLIGDEGIERGTIGQSIESIISLIPNNENFLIKIIEDNSDNEIGINAFYILAYYNSSYIIKNKDYYIKKMGEEATMVIEYCEENGGFYLYG